MALSTGKKLGPYEIVAPLGAGGMGEVYRARDTRLARTVAIKILPAHLTENSGAKQRFEREARAISSLQHPNICTLYDVGHQDGTDFLVLEHLDGETLADRLAKGPLSTEQALEIGIEICAGLAAAHGRGVLHRDVKPGNIMLTAGGAKLLDFGLAKSLEGTPRIGLTSMPTTSKAAETATPVTAEGTIVGTFPYMSPEQLEGKEADERSDIFALGAVLYEMAAGKRAFAGKSQSSVMAAILEREPPPISQLRPMSPPALDRVVKICLAKNAEARWQSARDVQWQLKWIAEGNAEGQARTPKATGRRFAGLSAWGLAAVSLLAAIVFAAKYFHRGPQAAREIRSSLLAPAGFSYLPYNSALSPDGSRLAFVATDSQGKNTLWVRALSAANAQQLEGTQDASYPFWSPDDHRIGFFAQGKLKTVSITSGSVRILCEAPAGRGGTWNGDGVIVFAPDIFGPLQRIAEDGGAETAVTKIPRPGSGQGHHWPSFLPDGQHFLYFVDWSSPADPEQNGIYVASLEGGPAKLISTKISGNVTFASGDLLYVQEHSLMAQPFDAGDFRFTGNAVAIAEQELPTDVFSKSDYSVSQNGDLVFASLADSSSRLEWYDAKGKPLGQVPGLGYSDPRISPDGRLLAVTSDDSRNGQLYIRVIDLVRGISTRITNGGAENTPAWSPDGKWISYNVSTAGIGNSRGIWEVRADGSGQPSQLLRGAARGGFGDWSPDGRDYVYSDFSSGIPVGHVYSMADKTAHQLTGGAAECRYSPAGKWIACGGLIGIVVLPYPGPGSRLQISNGPAAQPVWGRDGRQIFYISPDKKLTEVDFDPQKGVASAPHELFQTRIVAARYVGTQYDVARGGRFLINSLPSEHSSPLTLLAGWNQGFERR